MKRMPLIALLWSVLLALAMIVGARCMRQAPRTLEIGVELQDQSEDEQE